ncbi:MAG TPA: hypothetical protein VN697_06465 [Tepidiformaceae bacterium]|nr:hypothetical protein [Tepidiformaceae bacterium]
MRHGPESRPADDAWAELGDDNAPGGPGAGRWFVGATAVIVAVAAVIWAVSGADGAGSLARDIILLGLLATACGCLTLARRLWDPMPLSTLRFGSRSQRRAGEMLILGGVATVGVGIVVMMVVGVV